jgi:hypothetical protein
MLCIICNKRLIVDQYLYKGDYGMTEVEINTHCSKCSSICKRLEVLANYIECIKIEMKGHLWEYRNLKKQREVFYKEMSELKI